MKNINNPLDVKIDFVRKKLSDIALYSKPAVFASSFGAEDMVLMDMIYRYSYDIEIFTLDTGRLPEETYQLIQQAKSHYDREVKVYRPDVESIDEYVNKNGLDAFYDSVNLRKQCCQLRKVEPLKRALENKRAWITGMRRSQAVTRDDLLISEWDDEHKLQKFNPLHDWSNNDVWAYIHQSNVPYNKLHDMGYASIGCAPCTRAIASGEDVRAGRWWWESPEHKECGLHPRAK